MLDHKVTYRYVRAIKHVLKIRAKIVGYERNQAIFNSQSDLADARILPDGLSRGVRITFGFVLSDFEVSVLDSLLALEERSVKRKFSLDPPLAFLSVLHSSERISFFKNA